ncbi:ATP-binding protein [Labilithrix luteola]|uniref:ATP-binding protein n=1 Tax=Labilithrix luteola TaxID=1391654 RepID=UPI000A5C7E72|nr:AAA family ATPase [Labilithrix luteola]
MTGAEHVARLERKTAAMLALLVVDGETARSRVAGLLWPESKERTARNNLAQAIRRLHRAVGAPLVLGDEVLSLRSASSDVADLLLEAHEGPRSDAPREHRDLLAGYDFDDCSDFDGWLRTARATLLRSWSRTATGASERFEREGSFDDALGWAEAVVTADPVSEQAHLRVVRLWLARGDAPAAMRAYERCKKTLARELGMNPSEAMLEALKAIRAGRPTAAPHRKIAQDVPALVLHPRRIGRGKEWSKLERAFEAGRGVVVSGEPGVGKSRLLRDFCTSKGSLLVFEGRPGDSGIAYGTLARALRALVRTKKFAPSSLPAWASGELARVLPELAGTEGITASPDTDKLRLFEAVKEALLAASVRSLLVDDLQWVDRASSELASSLLHRSWYGELPIFAVVAHREGELRAEPQAYIERAVESDAVTRIVLAPLDESETRALLASLELPVIEGRSDAIAEASRGYPLYVLEIVRAIVEEASSGESAASSVPVTDRMKALFRRRLDRLSEGAVRLARVASLAGTELDVALAAHVLGSSPMDLSDAWSELERAQVLEANRFTHDVLAEAVRESIPAVVRTHVHALVAEHLARTNGDAARIADHFMHGGRPREAVPFLFRAAETARGLSCIADTLRFFDRAVEILEEAGDWSGASRALYERARSTLGAENELIAARMERAAKTPGDRSRAVLVRSTVELERGDREAAEASAILSSELALESNEVMVRAYALQVLFEARLRAGKLDDAERTIDVIDEVTRSMEDRWGYVGALYDRGEVATHRGQYRTAVGFYEEAIRELDRWGRIRVTRARGFAAIVFAKLALGDVEGAELAHANVDADAMDAGAIHTRSAHRLASARLAVAKRSFGAAAGLLDPFVEGAPARLLSEVKLLRAEIAWQGGSVDAAERDLAALARDAHVDAWVRVAAHVMRAWIGASRSKEPSAACVRFVEEHGGEPKRAELQCIRALTVEPAKAKPLLAAAESAAEKLDLEPLSVLVRAVRADLALREGRPDDARALASQASADVQRGVLSGPAAEVVRRVLAQTSRSARAQ